MTIREIVENGRPDWARLREALWPGAMAEHEVETRDYFQSSRTTLIIFVAVTGGRVVGFLELGLRKTAVGCASSPVPCIEGWYVEPHVQGRGIGRALVAATEAHARAQGYREIASDARLENR